MTASNPISIHFIPTGPGRVRLVCRLAAGYVLVGEYRDGVLRKITLVKSRVES